MSTHEQLQSENKTLHTDLQALTATISAQGAELAEARELLKRVTLEVDINTSLMVWLISDVEDFLDGGE